MHPTYWEIIQDCVSEVLLLPRDEIDTEVMRLALGAMNEHALIIWSAWKWDNEKMDEFQTPDHDDDGIITFAEDVESVLAVKLATAGTDYTTFVWNEDELLAAVAGETVSTDRFQHLAADSDHCRRILIPVPSDGSTATYRALCLKKYTRAIIDADYDAGDPSATPTDYRYMTFILDRAEPALRAAVKDTLRGTQGIAREKNFDALLRLALTRETRDNARELRTQPKSPMYSEIGDWSL